MLQFWLTLKKKIMKLFLLFWNKQICQFSRSKVYDFMVGQKASI